MMIDIHTHILAGIDDGPSDIENSRLMLLRLAEQNVNCIGLTPHYYHTEQSIEDFLAARESAINDIQSIADELGILLLSGSETYLTEDLLNERDIKPLCFSKTRLLLTEMPVGCRFSKKDMFLFERFIGNYGIIPILAHIERYPPLFSSEKLIIDLMEMGCLTQINIYSITDSKRSTQKKLLRFLEKGYIHFIGTDCHHMDYRTPEYKKHMELLINKLGDNFVDQFQISMARWLKVNFKA
jgi:protein-tyrosine phosphatase